jgi:hypothetical protein
MGRDQGRQGVGMKKYRTSAHDAPVRQKPADVIPSYIPILDENGNNVGHVHGLGAKNPGPRFGIRDATLKKVKGVGLAWQGTSAAGRADARHAQAVRTAKGSVTKNPTRPETTARPKR